MPVWESIVAQREWMCRVQCLAVRRWFLEFICLGRLYYGPDTVWFNGTPPIIMLSAGPVTVCCIFWQSRDDQEIDCKTTKSPELEISCSSTPAVSKTLWFHEHFTSQLPRFLGPRNPLFRLSLAGVSQAILGKPQFCQGTEKNARHPWRSHKSCQIPLKNMNDLIQLIRLCCSFMVLQNLLYFMAIIESLGSEWWHWKHCQDFNCVHSNVLSLAMKNSQESDIF